MTNIASVTTRAAHARFCSLDPFDPRNLVGLWRGRGVPTDHPLDGVLENLGWFGKRFHPGFRADALLFQRVPGRLVAIEPALIPLRLTLCAGSVGRTRVARSVFLFSQRFLRAQGTTASIDTRTFDGVGSAAMIYDRQPITDYFRRVADDRVMGMMLVRDDPRPYFFDLARTT
jgi:hypothetical protein